ncbi:MAG: hypothetical protein IPK62_13710 [Bacteroidetes bacterium]|nr:hypothetical protein [Bacteroidota bacterium]
MNKLLLIIFIAIASILVYAVASKMAISIIITFSILAGWCANLLVLNIFGSAALNHHKDIISKWEKDMEG